MLDKGGLINPNGKGWFQTKWSTLPNFVSWNIWLESNNHIIQKIISPLNIVASQAKSLFFELISAKETAGPSYALSLEENY